MKNTIGIKNMKFISSKKLEDKNTILKLLNEIKKNKYMYILLLPGLLFFIIFKYLPLWGLLIAFENYQPYLGFFKSEWVGLVNFKEFFMSPDFLRIFRNTMVLSLYNIIFYFPMPIILALLLNEMKNGLFKRFIQTLVYIPHFISIVIVASLTYVLLTTEGGVINEALFKLTGEKISFLTENNWFRPIIISQSIWKETGWGTIIFLAALAGVDIAQYEAAIIDGANRFQQLLYITLPAIANVIIILLILRMGTVLDSGFEQIFLMTNSLNREVGEVFNTYVYTVGISQGAFSYSTVVGMFKSVISVILVLSTNKVAKLYGHSGLY